MTIWTGLKLGLVALALAWVYHLGGEAATVKGEKQRVALAQAAVTAINAQAAQLKTVEDSYDAIKDVPDPVAVSATRLLLHACGFVPEAAPVATGTDSASPQPRSPLGVAGGLSGPLERYIEACAADAKQLNAVTRLAP